MADCFSNFREEGNSVRSHVTQKHKDGQFERAWSFWNTNSHSNNFSGPAQMGVWSSRLLYVQILGDWRNTTQGSNELFLLGSIGHSALVNISVYKSRTYWGTALFLLCWWYTLRFANRENLRTKKIQQGHAKGKTGITSTLNVTQWSSQRRCRIENKTLLEHEVNYRAGHEGDGAEHPWRLSCNWLVYHL